MNRRNVQLLFHELCSLDNVVGLGHGNKWVRGENTQQEAIIVLVKKKISKSELKRNIIVPKKIDGIITDVIEVGDISFYNEHKNEHKKLLRPAQPGISIGHYKVSAGTFGAVVRDRSTGDLLILSNNHVLANLTDGADGRSDIGDSILQPGTFDNGDKEKDVIGKLARFVPLYRETNPPQCKYAKMFENIVNKIIGIMKPHYRIQVLRQNELVNLVDCAVAAPVNSDIIKADILGVGPPVGIKEPKVGMKVKKSGRSSGVTYSIVLATNVSIKIKVNQQETAVFTDQVLAGPMSMPGDSGSLILSEDNYAIGLLFAGSEQATMFNRIDNVFDALNVTL